jgi:hypothetical protein
MNEAPAPPRGGNGKAVALGILAMLLGAALWAVITIVTGYRFGLMPIGVGALVGLTMFSARPTSTGIAAVAALLTVIGGALGEFLAIPAYAAHERGIGYGKLINLQLKQPRLALEAVTCLLWLIGAVTAFSMVYRRVRAARVETAARIVAAAYAPQRPYGTGPGPGAAARPGSPYAPQQPYGGAPRARAAAQPHPPAQQPYGQGPQSCDPPQQPYGQEQAPYGRARSPTTPRSRSTARARSPATGSGLRLAEPRRDVEGPAVPHGGPFRVS